jgi:hypothetical protein
VSTGSVMVFVVDVLASGPLTSIRSRCFIAKGMTLGPLDGTVELKTSGVFT